MADTFKITQVISTRTSKTFDNPTIDGAVWFDGTSTYTKYESNELINFGNLGANDIRRMFVEWDISELPASTNILIAKFLYHRFGGSYEDGHIHECLGERPSSSVSNGDLYAECGEGTIYAAPAGFPEFGDNRIVIIGADSSASACIDIENQITSGWFAIGIQGDDEVNLLQYATLFSENSGSANPPPSLYVEYDVISTCTLNQPKTIMRTNTRKTESFLFPDGTFKRHDIGAGGKIITMQGTETSNAISNFNTLDTMMVQGEYITLSDMNNSDLDTDWYITNFNWVQNEAYVDRYDWTLTLKET